LVVARGGAGKASRRGQARPFFVRNPGCFAGVTTLRNSAGVEVDAVPGHAEQMIGANRHQTAPDRS
jgi:hypothetical protein